MDLLERLVGGSQQRDQYQDFVNRFEKGSPYDSITDDEAVERYSQIAPSLSNDDFRDSAQQVFSRLSPQERRDFARDLRTQARDRGVSVPDYDLNDDGIDDRKTGALNHDSDGTGKGASVKFATLTTKPPITAADFLLI